MVSAPLCSSSYITFSPLKLRPAQTYRFKNKLLRQEFDNNLYSGHSLRGEGEEETFCPNNDIVGEAEAKDNNGN